MFDPVQAIVVSLLILAAGSIVSLAVSFNTRVCGWVSFAFVTGATVSTGIAAAGAFTSGSHEHTFFTLPWLGAGVTFRVDPLSAIFLAIVALLGPLSTLFSIRYMEHYKADRVAKFYPILLLCIGSMIGLLVSADLLLFLVFWESMTLTSYFLVIYERENAASQRAGLKYFIVTHAATLAMVAAALLLWRVSGSFHFDTVRRTLSGLFSSQPFEAHLIALLFFLGFATKAGILPMGSWLPDAHPVAPSGMSAMLSGALVKLGVYGLLRLFFSFLLPMPELKIWGIIVALAGTASLFVANLTALRQNDEKRLMAFSTIGQVGYICLGLGTGAYCLSTSPALASICIAGAIFHAVNHACFKSCLFLGAGSVLYRTHTRDMNELGGLAAFMPFTAGSTAIATLSIAGVPPLNGFTSKWLIVAGCILAGLRFPLFLLLGIIALFISLVSLAAFLKVLGSVFLGKADSHAPVKEVPRSMVVPQIVLAALCVVFGLFPHAPLHFIGYAVEGLTGVPASAVQAGKVWGGFALFDGSSVAFWWPIGILGGLAILMLLSYGIQHLAKARVRRVPVWYCGEEHQAKIVAYPASSFALPFRQAFRNVYPTAKAPLPRFPVFIRRLLDFDKWVYDPAAHAIEKASGAVSKTHAGILPVYLLWMVIGAIVVVAIALMVAR